VKKSKNWLNEATKLCDELDHEDGVDPRVLARKYKETATNHKNQQLCKEAQHTLSLVLNGELRDPVFDNLEIVDVSTNKDGQFLLVSINHINTGTPPDEKQILNRLQAIQGYIRSAIAQSVNRKRVPSLKFKLLQAPNEENSDAYSKNN
jgi:ribosome-binding factor A